jgi:hypothetical protein
MTIKEREELIKKTVARLRSIAQPAGAFQSRD